jgi:preprotein translocase subunit SecA
VINIDAEHQRAALKSVPPPQTGINGWVDNLRGRWKRMALKGGELPRLFRRTEMEWADWIPLHGADKQAEIDRLSEHFRRKPNDREALPRALALLSQIAQETLGYSPYPVQRRGALVLALGGLAEMATGEGKTTVVALWAAIAGWSRKPCHIVTANDYLARRDAEVMAPFYTAVGLSVGSVTGDMPRQGRGEVYARDLVYTTSKELLADFLRDRIQMGRALDPTLRFIRSLRHPGTPGKKESTVLRGIHTAIVDEADSVLIDEAVTPLRISSKTPHDSLKTAYRHCSRMVRQLRPGKDYLVNQRFREIKLLDQGWDNLEDAFGGLSKEWATPERFEEIINHSLEAREFYKVDRDYIIKEGKIQIVDSFTGRTLPDRSWSQGLHQAIEAKEEIELTDPSETLASLSFQRFFRLFFRLSGLTGTAMEAADEFWRIYAMPVIRVPRNKPLQRVGLSDRLFPGRKEKWKTLFQVVQQAHESGQTHPRGNPDGRRQRASGLPSWRKSMGFPSGSSTQSNPRRRADINRPKRSPLPHYHRHQYGRSWYRYPPPRKQRGAGRSPRHRYRTPLRPAHRPPTFRKVRTAGGTRQEHGPSYPSRMILSTSTAPP